MKLRQEYWLVKFKILKEVYYTLWYTDDIDGFLLDTNGILKFFLTKEEAVAFAEEKGFWLDTKEFLISSEILKKINAKKIDCELFLNHWNTFSDVAHSINCQFIGDSKGGMIRYLYMKLFYGCNLLVKEEEEHYYPKWSKKEKCQMAKIMTNGLKILSKGLGC